MHPLTPAVLLSNKSSTDATVQQILDTHALITEQLKIADAYQKVYADRKTRNVEFAEGDRVWLSTDNLLIRNQPTRKFKQRYAGPYAITAKISSQAYRIRLPPSWNCHNVFHVSKLLPCSTPDAPPDDAPTAIEPPAGEYIVNRISAFKIGRNPSRHASGPALLFKVHWEGYDASHDSFEPYGNLRRVQALHDYVRSDPAFQRLLQSSHYAELHRQHPSRFPLRIP